MKVELGFQLIYANTSLASKKRAIKSKVTIKISKGRDYEDIKVIC